MAKPSSKKVARAARTTGGRTARGARPWGWYVAMAIVVGLGSFGVYQSREERIETVGARADLPPRKGDHWHAALGIYVCDKFLPHLADNGRDKHGIHTHGDGVIHVHPFDSKASGNNATIGTYADNMDIEIDARSFKVPGEKEWRDGKKCGDKAGEVQLFVNGERRSGNPASHKMADRDQLVLAFAPRDAEIPKTPPSAPNLDNLDDMPQQPQTPPPGGEGQPPADGTTPTTAADGTTPTTAPGTPAPTQPTDTTATSAP